MVASQRGDWVCRIPGWTGDALADAHYTDQAGHIAHPRYEVFQVRYTAAERAQSPQGRWRYFASSLEDLETYLGLRHYLP